MAKYVHGKNILLVEDDYINVKMVRLVLMKYNHNVDIAHNGLEALEYSKGKKYDLIFMDIRMPVKNGLETMEYIRNRPDCPNRCTPIIALTAHAFDFEHDEILKSGATDILVKPFTLDDLPLLITQHVCD